MQSTIPPLVLAVLAGHEQHVRDLARPFDASQEVQQSFTLQTELRRIEVQAGTSAFDVGGSSAAAVILRCVTPNPATHCSPKQLLTA